MGIPTLKIRDENGNVVSVPAIKGDKGDSYILTEEDKNEIADMVKDFELLSDITLPEDTRELCWTQTDSGKTLGNYKDFFIYFIGSFTKDNNEYMTCRANDGTQYFMYSIMPKKTSRLGFWILIESIASLENTNASQSDAYSGMTIKKSTYPNDFLADTNADILATQGMLKNNKPLNSDFNIANLKRHITGQDFSQFKNLYIGQPTTATSVFATGSRFLLFGRKA